MRRILVCFFVLLLATLPAFAWMPQQTDSPDKIARIAVINKLLEYSKSGDIDQVVGLIYKGTMTPAAIKMKSRSKGATSPNSSGGGVQKPSPNLQITDYAETPSAKDIFEAEFYLFNQETKKRQSEVPTIITLKKTDDGWKILVPEYISINRSYLLLNRLRIFISPRIDYSQPESVLSGFVQNIAIADFDAAQKCLTGVKITPQIKYDQFGNVPNYNFGLLAVPVIISKSASKATYQVSVPGASNTITLVRSGSNWLILPDSENLHGKYIREHFLNDIAIDLSNLPVWKIRKAMDTMLSNMKQVGLGVMMYVQDHDAKYDLSDTTLMDKVMPYIKSRAVFISPLDNSHVSSIRFNDNLRGGPVKAVNSPNSVIMLYDGLKNQPLFRYNGQAIIATADGVAHLVTKEEYAKYRWNP